MRSVSVCILFLILFCWPVLGGCVTNQPDVAKDSSTNRIPLFFREDFKETPAETPVTQAHIANPQVLITCHGPAAELIKKSHHDHKKNDPWYVWSGSCENGRWAVTLKKKDTLVDLSSGRIRLRTKQSGPNVLKIILGLDDGVWLVSARGFGETPDWHVFGVDISKLAWRKLNIESIKAGERVKEPDLTKVRSIGWTDLTTGKKSMACTRLDWIEVYGKERR